MPHVEDTRHIRRLLAGVVALLVALNMQVAAGLYFYFVPRPVDRLLTVLPIAVVVSLAVAVPALGIGFVRWLVAAQRAESHEGDVHAGGGVQQEDRR
jgi:mannose/fructose/N-acetylgalactosamine-specific phosphotransferase system component IIC